MSMSLLNLLVNIGGRECYYKEQCKVAGTFFMIPGWTYHWKRMFEQEFGNMDSIAFGNVANCMR